METIKSRANQHIKYARAVREGQVDERFFVEGKRLVDELLRSEIRIASLFLSVQFAERNSELIDSLTAQEIPVRFLSKSVFDSLAETKSPQGIAAIGITPGDGRNRIEIAAQAKPQALVVMLNKINNPGNLGAVIRSAEAFGVCGLIVPRGSTDPFGPSAIRGSMGSAFRVPIWNDVEFDKALEWGRASGFSTICADIGAREDISAVDWNNTTLLVLGSEAHGLSEEELAKIDRRYRINMAPGVESLNLAVAAGIVMFEATRARDG